MRRDYVTMTVAAIAIVVAAVSMAKVQKTNAPQSAKVDTLEKIKKTGSFSACYVPFATSIIKDPETGKLSGHSVDAVEYIANQINAKVDFVESTWGNLVADLVSGKCDMTLYYYNLVPRAYEIAFTDPLNFEGNTALVNANDSRFANIKDVMEFDKPEYTVIVANGESGHLFVKDNFKNAKIEVVDVEAGDTSNFLTAVSTKRADVGIVSSPVGEDWSKKHPEVRNVFAKDPFSLNPAAYAVRQDDLKFLNFLNNAFSVMELKGITRQFEKKYDATVMYKKDQFMTNGQ